MSSEFYVFGTNGHLLVKNDGTIASRHSLNGNGSIYEYDYNRIDKFDVTEWRHYYGTENIDLTVDIFDIGFWMDNQCYVPPEVEFRTSGISNSQMVVRDL